MKMKVCSVAFAMLLSTTTLLADSTNVTFDAALTNATGWAYSNDVKISADSDKHIFFNTLRSFIQSPEYPFIITSMEITLSCSNTNATRRLQVSPSTGTSLQTANVTSKDKKEVQSFLFDSADCVRSFNISLEGSGQTGNWHIYSAVISGVPLIEAPTNLQANDIKGTRCHLTWANPANAVSNRIDVSRVVNHEMAGEVLAEYDFAEFANSGGNPTNRTDDFIAQYPDFAGSSLIYIPAHTAGNIQISTDNQKGFLVHSGLSDCSDITLLLSLKIPNNSQGTTFGIGYEAAAGVTNEVAAIPMGLEFKTNRVSIAEIPADTPVIFNTQGANSKRRVVIDYLAFVRDYGPAYAETNLVCKVFASDGEKTVRGLTPNSSYVVQVSAFGADGNISPPSPPLAFETNNSGLPLVIKLQ